MKTVVELFGRDVSDTSLPWAEIIAEQICPFLGKRCYKVRKSSSEVSIGTCTVSYGATDAPVVICPTRFRDEDRIFADCIPLLTLHEEGNELHVIPEVRVPGGSVDFVLASSKAGKVVDFVGIEIQTLDTTGTVWPARQRVLRDLGIPRDDHAEDSTKSYGMNWKMTAKTILMQMHHKIETFEHVDRKLVLVIQAEFLQYMQREFTFAHFADEPTIADSARVHAYSLGKASGGHRALQLSLSLGTNSEGVATSLRSRSDSAVELDQIFAALDLKWSAATRFDPSSPTVSPQLPAPAPDAIE